MEKNKRSYLDKLFGTKKDEDGTPTGKKCIPCGAINAEGAKFCFSCGSAFPVIYDNYDAFISYRRETASDLASLLKVQLENNFHKRIFIDIKELQEGRFDEALLHRIEETPNFILILSKSSLDKCKEKSDWLKREIIHAIDTRRNIIPVLMKGFTFPTDDLWQLLPKQMRVLSSLNGINYDHIHQDADIRKIASYMKSEKAVPPLKLAPDPEEPPPPEGEEAKPVPGQSGPGTPGPSAGGPGTTGSITIGAAATKPAGTGQTFGVDTTPGQTKPVQVPPSGLGAPSDQTKAPYFPVTGILVVDSDGSETILTEFGVRVDSYLQLEISSRDDLTVSIGKGIKSIPWGQIEAVEIKDRDDCTIKMIDGTSLDHVKLTPSRLVGKTDNDIFFAFEFKNALTITTLRDSTLPGPEKLIRDIPILAKRAIPQANRWILTTRPEGKSVSVTADNFFYNDIKHTHTFILPGPHRFSSQEKFINFKVSPKNEENFTIGPFPIETATALAMALTRLNSLLSENNSPYVKKETPESVNPESIVILIRGDYLTVGNRDSKTRSHYYGPGTVLQYAEKGKGEAYPWYRFKGADGKNYWLERYNPVVNIDKRSFFRIAETDQVGYLAEISGERDEPWGSLEAFKFDDELLGPTDLRFDQIISMTSQNGQISIKKESGVVTGTLQNLANYKMGFNPKGPCLVTSDAVIPLVRTNRESSLTVIRINESEIPPLVPASVYGSKTQLKFLLKANSALGHFDETIPDMYMQLNEQSLGWMRIYIPQIIQISVDPECKEAPVTVKTSAGRVYKGVCHDPFNFSGSVISFANAKKPLVLDAVSGETG